MSQSETLLLKAVDAARLVGLHPSFWSELKHAGELPPPVRLGKRDYWSRDTLIEWAKQRNVTTKGNSNDESNPAS